jgi:hypothetical protein
MPLRRSAACSSVDVVDLPLAGGPIGDDTLAAVERIDVSTTAGTSSRPLHEPPRQGSRADAVLAQALDVQFNGIALTSASPLFGGDDLHNKLEELRRQLDGLLEERHAVLASSIALTGGLSIGYIVWLVRGGVLVTSMLSALPAWQMVDPLPVLAASGAGRRRGEVADNADDDTEVERLFDERRTSAPSSPSAPPQSTPAAEAAQPAQENSA